MLERSRCVLRPIRPDDGDLVLAWRNSGRVRRAMYSQHTIAQAEHRAWMSRLLGEDPARACIFEHCRRPVGFSNLPIFQSAARRCSWGFYLGVDDAPKGSGRALAWMTVARTFSVFDVEQLRAEVFAWNLPSLRLHARMGFREEGRLVAHTLSDGDAQHEVVVLSLSADAWNAERDRLEEESFSHTEACA